MTTCFHCGDTCTNEIISYEEKTFCCFGCKTVFEILNNNGLSYYYDIENTPGISPKSQENRFEFLKNEEIASSLLDFNEQETQVVSFLIPSIHCSSCIWILENLNKLNPGIKTAQVNFPKKTVRITFTSQGFSLYDLTILLAKIGYEPYLSLDDVTQTVKTIDNGLIYKLGVAGFAFGNIMFLSFPEYFEVSEFWLDKFKYLFRWLMFAFAVPVAFYSGRDYFVSAYKGLRSKSLNIDIPIALGISILFIRSSVDIFMDWGTGFFDSMAGLVFFLLVGKFFQQKTYAFLSFERDYKSYFPIAATRISKNKSDTTVNLASSIEKTEEETVQVYQLKIGDRLLIRNGELLPVDAILMNGNALIDYSFVTGEALPINKTPGDYLYAGGKQQAGSIEVEVLKTVDQSYLTQLWSNEIFSKNKSSVFQSLTDKISKRFTITLLSIATLATSIWLFIDLSQALNVFTAVLIVACPCAIALAAPFTLGNMLRIFGKNKLYMKDSSMIEQLAYTDMVVFDKTGTLTTNTASTIVYEGVNLTDEEISLITSTIRSSNHPLSRALYTILDSNQIKTLDNFKEIVGQGIVGSFNNNMVKIGSFNFVSTKVSPNYSSNNTAVHISINNSYKGCYIFYNEYRNGVQEVFNHLKSKAQIVILSGDNDGEKEHLKTMLPPNTKILFNQKPEDKLEFIKNQQLKGYKVLMIGDGLNDAGALAQSNVGISVSENINVFSPACDGILDASKFGDIPLFLSLSQKGIRIIKYAFIFSLLYNLIGLGYAVSGNLSPIVAAILMPISSISIVVFTTIKVQLAGRQLNNPSN